LQELACKSLRGGLSLNDTNVSRNDALNSLITPPSPILTFTQPQNPLSRPKTIGESRSAGEESGLKISPRSHEMHAILLGDAPAA
jgi:hypothetical protein